MGLVRFLLALSVLFAHINGNIKTPFFTYQLVGGEVAVVAFFIISGFYISFILNEKYIQKKNSYFLFITNRFLRIFPIYWIILIATIFYNVVFHIDYYRYVFYSSDFIINVVNGVHNTLGNVFIFTMITSVVQIPLLFTNFIVDPAWSLAIELLFYLLAPWLVKGSTKKIIVIFFATFILRIYVTHVNIFYQVFSLPFLFLPNLFFFLLGAFSYRIYRHFNSIEISNRWYYCVLIFLSVYILFYSFIPPFFFYTLKRYVLYFLIFLSMPFLFKFEKNKKEMIFLGNITYPLYISHLLVLQVLQRIPFFSFQSAWHVLGGIGIVLFIAYCLEKYVGRPIDEYRLQRIKVVQHGQKKNHKNTVRKK